MYRFIFLMVGPTLIGCGGTGEGAADEGGRGSNDGASTMSPGDTSAPVQDGATAHILSQTNGGLLALTLSGLNVQANQTSGASQTLSAFAKPI